VHAVALKSVTIWNQRSESSAGHGYWLAPVNSNGVSTSANTMLIFCGWTLGVSTLRSRSVPSTSPIAAPTNDPSNSTAAVSGSAERVNGTSPSTSQPLGNMSVAAIRALKVP
jgi:hypothetical protein